MRTFTLTLCLALLACAGGPRQALRQTKLAADAASAAFQAAYSARAAHCRSEMVAHPPGEVRLRAWDSCMGAWDAAARHAAHALDVLGAGQRAAYDAIVLWEAGQGERARVDAAIARATALLADLLRLVELVKRGPAAGPLPPTSLPFLQGASP
jgi:hypothetical protein